MADLVVLVPGILGSDIYRTLGFRLRLTIWPDPRLLALYGLQLLRLDANGAGEFDSRWNGRVFGGRPLPLYYGALGVVLKTAWDLVAFGYDWRKPLLDSAQLLADWLQVAHPGRDVWLVGHSLGGLVARLAWRVLDQLGQGNRVKRVLTIGCPSWGSYTAALALARVGWWYSAFSTALQLARGGILGRANLTTLIDRPMCSWPSQYQILPSPHGGPTDPHRIRIYQPGSWEGIQPSLSLPHLVGVGPTQAAIAAAIPPDLVQVLGFGVRCPESLDGPTGALNSRDSYRYGDGDGTVSLLSGMILNRPIVRLRGEHGALPRHPLLLQHVNIWLRYGTSGDQTFDGPMVN